MTGKNITKRILYCVLLAIAVSLMFFYVRNEYKTYTDSKVVKADVINVSGTKNGMLDIKYWKKFFRHFFAKIFLPPKIPAY